MQFFFSWVSLNILYEQSEILRGEKQKHPCEKKINSGKFSQTFVNKYLLTPTM